MPQPSTSSPRLRAARLALAALALATASPACSGSSDGGGAVGTVQLSESVLRLRVGTEGALTARVLAPPSARWFIWSRWRASRGEMTRVGPSIRTAGS